MLECKNLNIYKEDIILIENKSFIIQKSEIYTLTGMSGAGKSTLLKYICGIEQKSFTYKGEILINQQSVNHLPTNQRGVRMIFQNDLLFSHMNVIENLLFAMPLKEKNNKEEALTLLSQLKLDHLSYKNNIQTKL